jgi:hypothetical protein
VVAGALANKPGNPGEALVRLSWAAGLARLGFRVLVVEQIAEAACRDGVGLPCRFADSINRTWFRRLMHDFGWTGWCSLLCDNGESEGLAVGDVLERVDGAPLLVNISGHLDRPSILARIRRRVFVDIDPGFTQFWHVQGVPARLEGHNAYFTIAANIGRPDCAIPAAGVPWKTVRQPVILDWWPAQAPDEGAPFTTVATWRCPFGRIETESRRYSLKLHQFRRFAEVPRLAGLPFEVALEIHPGDQADADRLSRCGWRVTDAADVAADPAAFRLLVQRSMAEFSVAQGIYVETASGWFSDRSVRYLASARPVLVQDTGFGKELPTGEGIVAFQGLDDAVRGAHHIVTHLAGHVEAARDLAARYFSADVVLPRFVEQAGVAA